MRKRKRKAFSLVELVTVVVIIGIIAAIAVPRMTTASEGASGKALSATLRNVRVAIDNYYAEHSEYPGFNSGLGTPDGKFFKKQLLEYTDSQGAPSLAFGDPFIFGPYLRGPFPKNPANGLDTVHVKAKPADPNPAPGSVGWVAVLSHGYFGIFATDAELEAIGIKEQLKKDEAKGFSIN